MSRPIKLRAWLPVGPWNEAGTERKYEMVGPDALAFEEYAPLAELLAGCENLMQFTGLHDKNGREIYEGDLAKDSRGNIWRIDHMGQKYAGFGATCITDTGVHDEMYPMQISYGWIATRGLEVIGNIWENPDLLEVPHAKL